MKGWRGSEKELCHKDIIGWGLFMRGLSIFWNPSFILLPNLDYHERKIKHPTKYTPSPGLTLKRCVYLSESKLSFLFNARLEPRIPSTPPQLRTVDHPLGNPAEICRLHGAHVLSIYSWPNFSLDEKCTHHAALRASRLCWLHTDATSVLLPSPWVPALLPHAWPGGGRGSNEIENILFSQWLLEDSS